MRIFLLFSFFCCLFCPHRPASRRLWGPVTCYGREWAGQDSTRGVSFVLWIRSITLRQGRSACQLITNMCHGPIGTAWMFSFFIFFLFFKATWSFQLWIFALITIAWTWNGCHSKTRFQLFVSHVHQWCQDGAR